jgi:alkanesulfonate monooxygenase SsuD/methylene tetrahydromethanopterin reductase-like flavin-dependent oxidoreductase (luciferase family)
MEVSGGRLRLGVGLSHRSSMADALGLDMGEPLAVLREYLAVLRAALQGQASLQGRYYRVRWTGAFRAPAPPVLLAALAPPMLELAGELADGVVLWLCRPAYIRDVAVPALARGRARAGQALEGFEIAAALPLAVTEDHAGATRLFREELARYLSLPYYRTMFRASGFGDALVAFDRDRAPGRDADAVPVALVDALGAVGDARRARAEVDAYRAVGVTLPIVRPIGPPEAAHARGTLEAVAP